MQALESLQFHLQRHGLTGVMVGGLRWGRRQLLDRRIHRIVRRPLPATEVKPSAHLVTRRTSVDELVTLGYEKAIHYRARLKAREAAGQISVGVFVDGVLGHVAWMDPSCLPVDQGLPPIFLEGAAEIFDMYTLEGLRRRGCQTAALRYLLQEAGSLGCRCALAAIHPGNSASLSGFAKCGFEDAAEASHARILSWTRVRISPPLQPC